MQQDRQRAAKASDGGKVEVSHDELSVPQYSIEGIIAHMRNNAANTLPMAACLDVCAQRMPYREAESKVAGLAVMERATQNPHVLIGILVDAGAIEKIPVEEPPAPGAPVGLTSGRIAGQSEPKAEGSAAEEYRTVAPNDCQVRSIETDGQLPDQPDDYLLETTELGRRALAQFEPTRRFGELMAEEPETYPQAYAAVLRACEGGATLAQIETALKGNEALSSPKTIYPSYFVSKLERVGGIVWADAWNITEKGEQMLASVG